VFRSKDDQNSVPDAIASLPIDDAIAPLVIATGSHVFPVAHWFQADIEAPLVDGVWGWGGSEPYWHFTSAIEPTNYDPDRIREVFNKWLALTSGFRRKLNVAVNRVNAALVNRSIEDTALDLGMALESMLTSDLDPDASISYMVRLRGALLLGGGTDERLINFRLLRDIYRLRSKAAHGLQINDMTVSQAGFRPSENLVKGCSMAVQILQGLINLGSMPVWDEIILRGADVFGGLHDEE
jgi:hypothetical protein